MGMGMRGVFGLFLISILCVRQGEASCSTQFKGKTVTFDSCADLRAGFGVYWTLRDGGVDTLFEAESKGWAGLGWGTNTMTPSDVVVVYATGTGADAKAYQLLAKDSRRVIVDLDDRQGLNKTLEFERSRQVLRARFLRPLATLNASPGVKTSLIYAVAPEVPQAPALVGHDVNRRGSSSVVLSAKGKQLSLGTSSAGWGKTVHGALMFASWGLLIPVDIILMRFMKRYKKPIFLIHSGGNAIAVLLVTVAAILGLIVGSRTRLLHLIVGFVVVAASIVQLLLGWRRPEKGTPRRVGWQTLHAWLGRGTLLLGWVNIIFGLIIFKARTLSIILCVVVFAANVAVAAVFSCMPRRFPVVETGPAGAGGERDLDWVPNEIDENNDAHIPPVMT